ncbi:MAG: hypothetical protein Q8R28_05325 [Dehalococcoidia bacterium]|nr:hypothetical protein [Dehalococcoidia bacterium]
MTNVIPVNTGIQRGGWAWVAGSRPGNDNMTNVIPTKVEIQGAGGRFRPTNVANALA